MKCASIKDITADILRDIQLFITYTLSHVVSDAVLNSTVNHTECVSSYYLVFRVVINLYRAIVTHSRIDFDLATNKIN